MSPDSLSTLLASLTAQLHTSNAIEEKTLENLQESIAAALLHQDSAGIRNQEFLFEKSDLFHSANLGREREKIQRVVQKIQQAVTQRDAGNMQVFVRTLPVRSTQLPGSVPAAAAGSRVSTIGPIRDSVTGRLIWFDFVKIKKLVPLYIQGQQYPAILFDAEFAVGLHQPANAPKPEITQHYKIVPDTVWIYARLFDVNAPDGYYAGLRVTGGEITLNANPQYVGTRLTISAATTVKCQLELEQNEAYGSDPDSPYGVDARHAKYKLPAQFQFSFVHNSKTITKVSDAAWRIYGQENTFTYSGSQASVYHAVLGRIGIPMECARPLFEVTDCRSVFNTLSGKAKIKKSWWGIPIAKIDIAHPTEADGNGALIALATEGLFAQWTHLQHNRVALKAPFLIGEPGRIGITDTAGNASGASQQFRLWKDELHKFGTSVDLTFGSSMQYLFNTVAKGDEVLACTCNADVQTDRPVKVDGTAVAIKSRNSLLILALGKDKSLFALADENMLWDNKLPALRIPKVRPMALAMHNALFTVTPPNGLVIFAEISKDFTALRDGKMFVYFGLFSYLPTLPDPYAADLGILESQFRKVAAAAGIAHVPGTRRESSVSAWLIGLIQWQEKVNVITGDESPDHVEVSFHFAPLTQALDIEKDRSATAVELHQVQANVPFLPAFRRTENMTPDAANFTLSSSTMRQDRAGIFGRLHDFCLLDVSSNANQMGIAFSYNTNVLQSLVARNYDINISSEAQASVFPIQMVGMDVVAKGRDAQAFTVPQISWEPVLNTTNPQCIKGGPAIPDPANLPGTTAPGAPYDPPIGWNYYQNDGIATRLGNLSEKLVRLSPIPLSKYLVRTYDKKEDGKTYAVFNLPFGMYAMSFLNSKLPDGDKPRIDEIMPVFEGDITGGLQLELTGGKVGTEGDSLMFEGFTFQLDNINDVAGFGGQYSNLAHDPDTIFEGEFTPHADLPVGRPGVPLEHIGISGYGASTFSNWENKDALFAQTSQAFFNVATGRTSREVVQVKSIAYPFGIRFVRTITLLRMGNGYVARVDSGWQAQSAGVFDFRNYVHDVNTKKRIKNPVPNPYIFHPGLIKGLFNIRNVKEVKKVFKGTTSVQYKWLDNPQHIPQPSGPPVGKEVELKAVTFDCDLEIENVVEGGTGNRVVSKGVTAYIQLEPPGAPIDIASFEALMKTENNSIGGPINCTIQVAGTKQRMRLDRFDMNTSHDAGGKFVVVGAVRGSVMLPKDGSWTLVQHNRGSGEVTPMPDKLSVPLICESQMSPDNAFADIRNALQRIAYPNDLLRVPDNKTINFGFLQNMNAQKVLFLTPAFKNSIQSLISKTPPLLADA